MKKFLTINRCPIHGFYAISLDDEEGCGLRLTPSKCCGTWEPVKRWSMDTQDLLNLSEDIAKIRHEILEEEKCNQ